MGNFAVMNNPFDYVPDARCDEAFRRLVDNLEFLKRSDRPEDLNFIRELETGKMLGVLIATDGEGHDRTLYAFSGQLGNGGFHYDGFVGPVFDYLHPDGYFKRKEADISLQNVEISKYEEETVSVLQRDYEHQKKKGEAEISEFRSQCRRSKAERDARRKAGDADETELTAMIRQSQFEKAELHRIKRRVAEDLEPLAERLKQAHSCLAVLKEKRRSDSEALQKWLFASFKLLNARWESKSLSEIFSGTSLRIPPSGAGECCAPKLLQAAYLREWHPKAIAEYWYGKPKRGEVRVHGMHYPACRGKCLPVLCWMLQGLDVKPPLDTERLAGEAGIPKIIYENQWFCVVEKPSGMLSVPGKGAAVSLQQWLDDKYGAGLSVKMAHRLDQDTSGVIIATFGEEPFRIMQALFATRQIRKTYIADLDGDYQMRGIPSHGRIELPLAPDWLDRPRQVVDIKSGKPALTEYEFTDVSEGRTRVKFCPHTGRTHQLRVHAASEMGLDMPIAGDRLYGRRAVGSGERLHLHACRIEFTFPLDGLHYIFESPAPF
jgi:tRNA pseudouridine32 synthase/23S rRNA pseudouridine746 synthase